MTSIFPFSIRNSKIRFWLLSIDWYWRRSRLTCILNRSPNSSLVQHLNAKRISFPIKQQLLQSLSSTHFLNSVNLSNFQCINSYMIFADQFKIHNVCIFYIEPLNKLRSHLAILISRSLATEGFSSTAALILIGEDGTAPDFLTTIPVFLRTCYRHRVG